jgi:hypothetical protein
VKTPKGKNTNVAFVALWYTILLGQRIKIIYTMLLQDQMMWLSISCIKIIQLHRKLEKVAANDGESNGFYNKNVGNYPYKQYSFIQGGDGGMEYAMCTLMLGNGTEFMVQQHMSWVTLGFSIF